MSLVPVASPNPIDTSGAHEAFVLHWANEFAVPALLVTLELRLIWANAKGQDFLLESGEISVSGDTLAFADKSQAGEFRNHLAGLNGSPGAWIYGRTSENSGLIRAEIVETAGGPPVAALMVFGPGATKRYYWGDIGKLFGLTRAEVAIVKRMVAGESATIMAKALEVSLETVRTHIRRIYNKLGVVGREELIATVSDYRTT